MKHPQLSLERLEIRRMPGFPRGGLDVDELCPGVNVIYGPNGSGKTTLSRAIQKLLRPRDPPYEDRSLLAWLVLDGNQCTIDCDLKSVKWQQEGADVECPTLAPADVGDKYVLALHELIRSEDGRDLAAAIARESAGGYDVEEARKNLGFREKPFAKGNRCRDLEAALASRQKARRQQDALAAEDKTLARLLNQRDGARAATVRLKWIEQAILRDDAQRRQKEAARQVELFPAGVDKLIGDEIQRLEKLRSSLSAARERRRKEELKVARAGKSREESNLPPEGVAPETVAALRGNCQRLQTLSLDVSNSNRKLEKVEAELEQAIRNLGPAIDRERFKRIDTAAVEELSRFARRAEKLRADATAAETLRSWLGPDDQVEPHEPETLSQAASLLDRWLEDDWTKKSPSHNRIKLTAGCVVIGFALLMYLVHLSWLVLLPAGIGLIVWAFLPSRKADAREEHRRKFEHLSLGGPSDWTADEVRSYLRQLRSRMAAASVQREKTIKWGDFDGRLEDLRRQRQELDREKAEWIERLGIGLEDSDSDEAWLYLLAANVNRLQKAEQDLTVARAELKSAQDEFDNLLSTINRQMERFGFEAAEDPDAASARVEQLAVRQQAHHTATERIAGTRSVIKAIDEEISNSSTEESGIFERVGLTVQQETTLRQWSRMHNDYVQAADEVRYAKRDLDSAEAALAAQDELLGLSRQQLDEEHLRCRRLAEEAESIDRQIGAIESAIEAAKKGNDLEEALAKEAECTDALRQLRLQDHGLVVGHLLADFVSRQERNRQRPAVFRRAQELFIKITHGRYRLDVGSGDPPRFKAFDTDREVHLDLDELSSGTRLQLLLAVRVAFVEQQERGVKLPLILDETLGNSDERRAEQIIDAAIEICREGRQVFYFTAQHDEARKWEMMLRRYDDVPRRLIDLAELRNFSESDRVPSLAYEPPEPVEVPLPDGSDWLQYGQLLGVPPFDPSRELGGMHLWYPIDDLPALYRLLKHGVNRWGQLKTLVDHRHDDSLSADSPVFRRAEAAVRLLDSASRYRRIGRGTPVDRQALAESEAVSEKFLDRVADLATELSGDAKTLIEALEGGKVRGFWTDKRIQLQDYLFSQGYIDHEQVLSGEQVREQTRLSVFPDLESGLLSPERFEQLVALVIRADSEQPKATVRQGRFW